jgi:hypothetical protein
MLHNIFQYHPLALLRFYYNTLSQLCNDWMTQVMKTLTFILLNLFDLGIFLHVLPLVETQLRMRHVRVAS